MKKIGVFIGVICICILISIQVFALEDKQAEITAVNVDSYSKRVTVTGQVAGNSKQRVVLAVFHPGNDVNDVLTPDSINGKLDFFDQTYCNDNGQFSFTYIMRGTPVENGVYRVYAGVGTLENAGVFEFKYSSPETISQILAVLKAADIGDIPEILENNNHVFQLDFSDYKTLTDPSSVHMALHNKNFTSPNQVRAVFEEAVTTQKLKEAAQSVLPAVNGANESSIRDIIEANMSALGIRTDIWSAYNLLSGRTNVCIAVLNARPIGGYTGIGNVADSFNHAVILECIVEGKRGTSSDIGSVAWVLHTFNDMLKLDFNSLYTTASPETLDRIHDSLRGVRFINAGKLKEAFQNKVEEESRSANNKPAPNLGGGGGGGGGGSTVSFEVPKVQPEPDTTEPPNIQESDLFPDLSLDHWARKHVTVLAEMDIVNGFENGDFMPDSPVTRAQFIKMLLMVLELSEPDVQSDFTDVSGNNGEWYYSYIASAQKLGITKGKTDGSFGVNDLVTRQDMAVFICNAAAILNLNIPDLKESVDFIDYHDIDNYAVSAAETLNKAGVMLGIPDESGVRFAPRESASRAMAAVVVCRIMDLKNEAMAVNE